jgi:predicted small integral membrane protein
MPTTRGDRLFIGIMSSIGFILLWLVIIGNQALWLALIVVSFFNIVLALRG